MVTLPPLVWRESPNQSQRLAPVRLVVVHRPVGSYAGATREFLNAHPEDPSRRVSAHVLVKEDGSEARQFVAWDRKAWACAGFNSASDNIETPDRIWQGPLNDELERVMQVCARIVAFRCHVRHLPAAWRTGADLLDQPGITRHFDLGAAGGGHADPTTDTSRWIEFMMMIEQELARGHFRKTWGRV